MAPITWPSDTPVTISRESALGLSVVKNARDLIVGIASQLSVDRLRGDEVLDPGTILTQPDLDETWPTTIGKTVDDLFFYGSGYWLVVERDSTGYPTRARALPWASVGVTVDQDWSRLRRIRAYQVGGTELTPLDIVRFTVSGLGLLRDAAPILLDALALTASAAKFTTIPLPAGVLTNTGQEIGERDAQAVVDAFDAAREKGQTAFLQSMTYERTAFNAADLQLVDALAATDARLARACNVPVSMVSASPTGNSSAQLYANVVAGFTQVVQQAVAPFLRAVEDALAAQVTPRGQRVAFDTGDWLRFAQVASPSPGLNTPTSPGGSEIQ